jgi:meiotically up-regulated gene 157 (Mug157) protein
MPLAVADVETLLPRSVVADLRARLAEVAGEKAAAVFERALTETLERTVTIGADGSAFVITGDIPAMWLRDSTTSFLPYVLLVGEAPGLLDVLVAIVRRQFGCLLHDPYANAFNDGPTGARFDAADLGEDPNVWERKYEVDSLAFPLLFAHRLWRAAGARVFADGLGDLVRDGLRATVELWRREQDHEANSPYRFVRLDEPPSETLDRDGLGTPLARTGMTWSGFRPSDDSCVYGYNVPANLFAARVLDHGAELSAEVFGDTELAASARELAQELRDGVAEHGVVTSERFGRVWAYEVDGLGGALLADDANLPSLLALPLLGACALDDPLYVATRRLVLSEENPYHYTGSAAAGIGSPHTPDRYVWPIAMAVAALTSGDREEQLRVLHLLMETDDGTGRLHEGFHVDDPSQWTREWFSWADMTFAELCLAVLGRGVLAQDA